MAESEIVGIKTHQNTGFPHLKETYENSLNFANSFNDLEIPWNFIKYINILEN